MVLREAYCQFNREWFDNKLPHDVAVKWARMDSMGEFLIDEGAFVININRKLKGWPSAWKLTLLHEMIHVATADEEAAHGTRWLRLRQSLIAQGAFTPFI